MGADHMTDRVMPRYKSHKIVHALQIRAIDDAVGNSRLLHFVDDGYPPVALDLEMWSRYQPVPGDYLVVYADGYKSFSPQRVFEDGYRAILRPEDEGQERQASRLPETTREGRDANDYLDTLDRMEKDISPTDPSAYGTSAAISLRRIADAAERTNDLIDGGLQNIVALLMRLQR
jgi:hypothetical protein